MSLFALTVRPIFITTHAHTHIYIFARNMYTEEKSLNVFHNVCSRVLRRMIKSAFKFVVTWWWLWWHGVEWMEQSWGEVTLFLTNVGAVVTVLTPAEGGRVSCCRYVILATSLTLSARLLAVRLQMCAQIASQCKLFLTYFAFVRLVAYFETKLERKVLSVFCKIYNECRKRAANWIGTNSLVFSDYEHHDHCAKADTNFAYLCEERDDF